MSTFWVYFHTYIRVSLRQRCRAAYTADHTLRRRNVVESCKNDTQYKQMDEPREVQPEGKSAQDDLSSSGEVQPRAIISFVGTMVSEPHGRDARRNKTRHFPHCSKNDCNHNRSHPLEHINPRGHSKNPTATMWVQDHSRVLPRAHTPPICTDRGLSGDPPSLEQDVSVHDDLAS